MNRKKVKKILLITIPMLLAIIAVTLGIVFSNISKKMNMSLLLMK